jgi:ribonuclease HI
MRICEIYTDASHCLLTGLATCGYLVVNNGKKEKHTVFTIAGLKDNIQAERFSIELSLKELIEKEVSKTHIVIYSDCESVLRIINGKSRMKQEYENVLSLIQKLKERLNSFEFRHVKGHSANSGVDNQINHIVDLSCRKRLKVERVYYYDRQRIYRS